MPTHTHKRTQKNRKKTRKKLKSKKIEDNTTEYVNILIHLAKGISPDVTIEALYGFTNCEIPISPNCCVINNNKPEFISVDELLRLSTQRTVDILKLINQEI